MEDKRSRHKNGTVRYMSNSVRKKVAAERHNKIYEERKLQAAIAELEAQNDTLEELEGEKGEVGIKTAEEVVKEAAYEKGINGT